VPTRYFRRPFAGFDPERVAGFGPADVERLLADRGIVRNRAGIETVLHDARRCLELEGGPPAWLPSPGAGRVMRRG
jgi:DNA-3-methyladenine glycosylase I